MSNDFAVDPHASEAGLPEDWRQHVSELRQENARRRKENQELRAQLDALAERSEQAETAPTAAGERGARDAARLAATTRRLKELEVARLARQALREAAAAKTQAAVAVDVGHAQRLLEQLPTPLNVDADVTLDDEGHVALEPAATERLTALVGVLVNMAAADSRAAAPPVGGEPPRPASPAPGPLVNAWDAEGQSSAVGRARANLRRTAAQHAGVLDEIAGL